MTHHKSTIQETTSTFQFLLKNINLLFFKRKLLTCTPFLNARYTITKILVNSTHMIAHKSINQNKSMIILYPNPSINIKIEKQNKTKIIFWYLNPINLITVVNNIFFILEIVHLLKLHIIPTLTLFQTKQ